MDELGGNLKRFLKNRGQALAPSKEQRSTGQRSEVATPQSDHSEKHPLSDSDTSQLMDPSPSSPRDEAPTHTRPVDSVEVMATDSDPSGRRSSTSPLNKILFRRPGETFSTEYSGDLLDSPMSTPSTPPDDLQFGRLSVTASTCSSYQPTEGKSPLQDSTAFPSPRMTDSPGDPRQRVPHHSHSSWTLPMTPMHPFVLPKEAMRHHSESSQSSVSESVASQGGMCARPRVSSKTSIGSQLSHGIDDDRWMERGGLPTSTSFSTAPLQTKDDGARRSRIILEIIATEKTYIQGLQELVDVYILPSMELDGNGQPYVSSNERRHVFANAEGILHFHHNALLPALYVAAGPLISRTQEDIGMLDKGTFDAITIKAAENIAHVFERYAAFFRMYSSYINNVDTAQQRVAAWLRPSSSGSKARFSGGRLSGGSTSKETCRLSSKERKRIKAFLRTAREDPRHSQLSLEAYLHLPVQRIPRYRLLLEELVRFCPPQRLRDARAITHALDSISGIASSMNERKRQSEMDRRLLEWQERIRGTFPSPLVQPHRKLYRDGPLLLKRVISRTYVFPTPARSSSLRRGNASQNASRTSIDEQRPNSPHEPRPVSYLQDEVPATLYNMEVQVLLCNDITVIVEENAATSPQVNLFSVLRVCNDVRIVDKKTLRLIDAEHLVYLEAASEADACAWKSAFETVQQPPGLPFRKPLGDSALLRVSKSHQALSTYRSAT